MIDIEPKYGKHPQQDYTAYTDDYEESFMKFIAYESGSPYYRGFITKFGDIKFAEIDNFLLKALKKSIF